MQCPKCNAEVGDSRLFCTQCGHRFQLDPIEGQVMSMDEWRLKKSREKDEARKAKMDENKPKYEAIKDRMYNVQSEFGVEDLEAAKPAKKNKQTAPVTTQAGDEDGDDGGDAKPSKYSELYDFESVATAVMDDIKKDDKKIKYERGMSKEDAEAASDGSEEENEEKEEKEEEENEEKEEKEEEEEEEEEDDNNVEEKPAELEPIEDDEQGAKKPKKRRRRKIGETD